MKMNQEKGVIFLTALVALGIACFGVVCTLVQSLWLTPIVVMGLIFFILILLTNKGHFAHKIESLEKVFFIITFLVIVVSFILLYKPI